MLNPSRPGPTVRDLWMTGRSEAETARGFGLAEAELDALLDGMTDLTRQLALILERIGWSNAEFWMRLQAACDRAQERLRRTAAA